MKTLQLMAEIVNGFFTKYEHPREREGERETLCLFFDALLTLIVEFNLSTRCTSRECTKCNIISLSAQALKQTVVLVVLRAVPGFACHSLSLFANGSFKFANYFARFKFPFLQLCNLSKHQNARQL